MFKLRVVLSDGFEVELDERFSSEVAANHFAAEYIRHNSDPCGLGVRVSHVLTIDCSAEDEARIARGEDFTDSKGNYWGHVVNSHGKRVRVCIPTA
jgi:hypothetical protein